MEAIEHAMEELERQAHMDMPQVKNLFEADVRFHMAIVRYGECDAPVHLQYVDKITRRSRMSTIDQIFQAGDVEETFWIYRRIVKLCRTGMPRGSTGSWRSITSTGQK